MLQTPRVLSFALAVMLVAWSWATDVRRRTPGTPPSWLRRAFLMYAPDRGSLGYLHLLFYLSFTGIAYILASSVSTLLSGVSEGNAPGTHAIFTPSWILTVYLAFVALITRILACGLETWRNRLPGWIKWFWPGPLPQKWTRRIAFTFFLILLYTSTAYWPYLAINIGEEISQRKFDPLISLKLAFALIAPVARWAAHLVHSDLPKAKAAGQS